MASKAFDTERSFTDHLKHKIVNKKTFRMSSTNSQQLQAP